ncbi:MAG: ABC transporter substrate-binding protein [Nitrospirae bacterium]|nr:ABC transporter substrate-binding protein [Nitrospirota bacterium]
MELMKRFVLIVLLILSTCKGSPPVDENKPRQPAAQTIKIGVIAALTGSASAYGRSIVNGFELAAKEINSKGGITLELIIEDSAGRQEQALSAAQKLINSNMVAAILGPTLSTEMRVVGPLAVTNGVPILATSNTAAGITQIGRFVFRNSMPETIGTPLSIQMARDKYNIKKAAIIYGDDDVFTKSGFDTMKATAERLGITITTIEKFQKGQADYSAQLTKIKADAPDAILCSALFNEGAVILQQARKLGIDVPVIGGNGFNSPKIIELAGQAAEGLIVATPWFSGKPDKRVQDFVAAYKAAYGTEPDQFAAQAYDGLYLMDEAIRRSGTSEREKVRDALASIKDFDGVMGRFSFDADRDVVMAPLVIIVKDGRFQLFN